MSPHARPLRKPVAGGAAECCPTARAFREPKGESSSFVKDAASQSQTVKGDKSRTRRARNDRRHGLLVTDARGDQADMNGCSPTGAYGRNHARGVVHRLRHLQIPQSEAAFDVSADLCPATNIDEVVVVGYGTQKKANLHGRRGQRVAERTGRTRPFRTSDPCRV